jgi:pseudaminic acid cytidylyltransferase
MAKIAIIPARGGSKRIPRKNIRDFFGKPLIGYSIEKAIACNLFDEVMVSTEDEEIAEIALRFGAKVPFLRSDQASDDYTTTAEVLIEVFGCYSEMGIDFQWGCCIYPFTPLLNFTVFESAFKKMNELGRKSIFSVLEYSHPLERAIALSSEQNLILTPQNLSLRTQDAKKYFHDAGQFYWFEIKNFLNKKQLILPESSIYKLDPLEAQDLDTEIDWKLMELKYQYKQTLQ